MPISGNPGAIPDVDEWQPPAAQQAPEQAPEQEMAPAEGQQRFFRDAAPRAAGAINEGIAGLKRIFLGGPQQGIPTEESGMQAKQGAQRFARGEGAATSEDIQAIDYATGVDQLQADEGTKNMIRLDRATNYHLSRGDKDKAEATAASLLQRGAVQVKNAAHVAQAAFEAYQQTGDPKHLQAASQAMKKAHQLIPDGFDLELNVDPKTHQLVATTTDSEGKATSQVIDPRAVPGLLKGAMDGSAYWKSVFRLGHPSLAGQAEDDARARIAESEKRGYNEGYDQFKFERDQQKDIDEENRRAERWRFEQDYQNDQGRSAGERMDAEQEEFFSDWNERLAAAQSPEDKRAVTVEGMGYRYENARDRSQPIAGEELMLSPNSQFADTFSEEDLPGLANIARIIAQKNGTLDAPGAMEVAGILATQPQNNVNSDGTLNANGFPLVFNPQLLPQLNELRKKYRVAQ